MARLIPIIPKIRAKWNRRSAELPVLTVPMSDGSKVEFYPDVPQPSFIKSMEMINRMKEEIIGYQRK